MIQIVPAVATIGVEMGARYNEEDYNTMLNSKARVLGKDENYETVLISLSNSDDFVRCQRVFSVSYARVHFKNYYEKRRPLEEIKRIQRDVLLMEGLKAKEIKDLSGKRSEDATMVSDFGTDKVTGIAADDNDTAKSSVTNDL